MSLLVRCPDVLYTNREFGTAKCVLFIEVSSFQGVQIRGVSYTCTCSVYTVYVYSVQNKVSIMLGHLAAQEKFCLDKLGFCSDMKIETSLHFSAKLPQHFHG